MFYFVLLHFLIFISGNYTKTIIRLKLKESRGIFAEILFAFSELLSSKCGLSTYVFSRKPDDKYENNLSQDYDEYGKNMKMIMMILIIKLKTTMMIIAMKIMKAPLLIKRSLV